MKNNFKKSNFLLYKTPTWEIKVDVLLQDENIWMSQKSIAELFWVKIPAISKHLKNIFETWELNEKWTVSKMETVQKEGNREITREVSFYNLDVIIATWYRVNSMQATKFRIWANKILKEYIIKGFVMDDERLKNPNNPFWKDYFDEQLERIRDIRSSERRFYQKITDIFSLCSIDYDKNSKTTKTFFATVQNKLHWAITWETASEIIYNRVDSKIEHIWLTTWKNFPENTIRKTDVEIAKNYLKENEIDILNRIVSMYLDYAELQAKEQKIMTMDDWIKKLDWFLQFHEKNILTNTWKISKELAFKKAHKEFWIYNIKRLDSYISDFDIEVKKLKNIQEK